MEKSMNILKRDLEKVIEGNLEKIMVGIMKTLDLIILEERIENKMEENGIKIEEWMGHMDNNIERIVKLLQNIKEKAYKMG